MRYLSECGALERTTTISCVSGGSVATAALASAVSEGGVHALSDAHFEETIFNPFVAAVTGNNLRNGALKRWLGQRLKPHGRPRNLILGETLREALFPAVDQLLDLPPRPQVVFAATELHAGRAFRFSRDFIGSWDFGYVRPPTSMGVATAVAASAAAPPFIPPLQLDTAGLGLKETRRVLSLTDGGVYDNLGIEWFQGWSKSRPKEAVSAPDLIVINASGPLGREDRRVVGIRALNRSRKIQYAQTQATRVRWLVAELEAGRQKGLYLGITGDPRRYRLPSGQPIPPSSYAGSLPSGVAQALAYLRTDFNQFSKNEALLLAYHGYWCAHARFASLRPEEAVAEPRWRDFEGITETEAVQLEKELLSPRHRLGIGERLR